VNTSSVRDASGRSASGVPELAAARRRETIFWTAIVSLLFLLISVGLAAAPEVALQYWYLMSAPLILAAFRFGLRGALFASAMGILVLTFLFRAAGTGFGQVFDLAEQVLKASTNPNEAVTLVETLTNLRLGDVRTSFARALTGMILLFVASVMLGQSIDSRTHIMRVLERAFSQLRRYFSPQVVEVILNQSEEEGELESVRREVTILFCDLRGFTAFSEQLEPEQVAESLNEYLGAMSDVVFDHNGTVDKYIGDAVMAVFGAPLWYADHPEQAFRCAVAMQQRMKGLQEMWASQGRTVLSMGVGVSIGHAVVGNMGSATRREYTAIGSTVNVAARMTDIAPPGAIITTRKSYWRVQHAVDGVPREPVMVKGFTRPLEIVEVHPLGTARPAGPVEGTEKWLPVVTRCQDDARFRTSLGQGDATALSQLGLDAGEQLGAGQIALLLGSPLFAEVPAEEIAAVAAHTEYLEVPEGEVVLQQGAAGDKFYIISDGKAGVTMQEDGQERYLAILSRGDHFGEVALIFDRPRSATVRALTLMKMLVMDREAFYTVVSRTPTLRSRIEAASRARINDPYP